MAVFLGNKDEETGHESGDAATALSKVKIRRGTATAYVNCRRMEG